MRDIPRRRGEPVTAPEYRDTLGWWHLACFIVAATAALTTVPIGRMVNQFFEGDEVYFVFAAIFVLTYIATAYVLKHDNRGDRIRTLERQLKRMEDDRQQTEREQDAGWMATEQALRALEIFCDSYGEDGRPLQGKPLGYVVSRRTDINYPVLRIHPMYATTTEALQLRFRASKTEHDGIRLEFKGMEKPIEHLGEFEAGQRHCVFVVHTSALVVATQKFTRSTA